MVKIYAANVQNLPDPKDNLWIMEGLTEERKNKILGHKQELHRKQSLGAGLLLKQVLEQEDMNVSEICYGSHGKPKLAGIYFNLSHSDNYVVCTISDKPVGCDIQKIGKLRDKMAERYFTEKEAAYLKTLDDEKRCEEFYRIWTIKESYVKMTGEGLALGLNRIECRFENKENADDNGQNHVSIYRDGVKQKCYIREYELLEYKVTVCAEEAVFDSDIIKIKL